MCLYCHFMTYMFMYIYIFFDPLTFQDIKIVIFSMTEGHVLNLEPHVHCCDGVQPPRPS